MTTKPSEFVKLLQRISPGLDLTFIPVVEKGKRPDTHLKIKENIERIKISQNEALRRLQRGQNVGIYAFPDGLCFLDVDRPDLVDISKLPETFTVKTRNGGFQLYFLNPGLEKNYILKKDGQKVGELRANWQYVLAPGSHVPPDEEAFEGATGVYEVVRDVEIKPLDLEAIKWLVDDNETGEKEIQQNFHRVGFTNKFGISLEAILVVDEKLRELLTDLQPSGYPSRSEADMATVDKLLFWQFDENQIADILQTYRLYEKTERDDYIHHTIEKAISSFNGERFNPTKNPQLFLKLCKIQEDLNKGVMSNVRKEISGNGGKFSVTSTSSSSSSVPLYFISGMLCGNVHESGGIKVRNQLDETDEVDVSVENTPFGEQSSTKLDIIPSEPAEFFDDKGKFIAKRLADKIMAQVKFITLTDTEEVWFYDEEQGVWRPNGEIVIKALCEKYLGEEANTHRVNEVIGHIQRSTYRPRSIFDSNIEQVAVKNGVLNLRTLELRPFDPELYLTVYIPVKFDPTKDCPKIKEFLRQIVHEDDIPLIFEIIGYTLWRRYFIHKAFMYVGDGRNGKSTLQNLHKIFLGSWNYSNVPLQALTENRFAPAELYGKLANFFADISSAALRETGYFKALVGEDTIMVERKFKNPFKFTNYAKLIFSCNQLPRSLDESDAFFARWIIINFPNKFEGDKADKNILEKLTTEDELSGLLNNALLGLHRLLEKGEFSKSPSTDELRETYIRMSDPIMAFIMDCIETDPESYVVKQELYAAFCEYCRKNKLPIVSDRVFGKRIVQELNVVETRPEIVWNGIKRPRAWKGIKLREPEPEILEEDGLFVCSRCGCRFLTESDALHHIEEAKNWPEICHPKQEVEEEVIDLTGFMEGDA